MPTKTNIVDLAIGFDEGSLSQAEYIQFASDLVHSGLVNSTGTFQRFVQNMIDAGFIDTSGDLTVLGVEYVEAGE